MRREHYPELRAGGFTRVDGSVQFYLRVQALLEELGPDAVVLDFGAGRGALSESTTPIRERLTDLRGKARTVIGVDIDGSVLSNPRLTRAHVLRIGTRLPLPDSSVDLILADHVFEHIEDPSNVAQELRRVLRVGGWLCARTPHRWGYIGIGGRVVPDRVHASLLKRFQPKRKAQDVFPTAYRLNTRGAIARRFPPTEFEHVVFGWEPEPAYAGRSWVAAATFRLLGRITPEPLRPVLLVFLRRRPAEYLDGNPE